MNKLDTNYATLMHPAVEDSDLGPSDRLVVLIPADFDCVSPARRISDLAKSSGAHVLLLGLCEETAQSLGLRRELTRLSALLQDNGVSAEIKIEIGMNWLDVVKSIYQAGDLIVCFTERRIGLTRRPLSQILRSDLGAPVYILSELSSRENAPSHWISRITAWAGFAGILAGALLLQIQITSLSRHWAQTILLIVSVLVEFWLIRVWNELFS